MNDTQEMCYIKSKRNPMYAIYNAMVQRCCNPNCKAYKDYGGRGIKVDSRWLGKDGFRNWLNYLGLRPGPNYSLDRIDNDGNYEPRNCEWVTRDIQNKNTRKSSKTENFEIHDYFKRRIIREVNRILREERHNSKFVEKYLGCTIIFLKQYIESKWKENMCWENRGFGDKCWCLDHIIPLRSFDLSKEEDRLKAFHYTNLQPLWWNENMKKGWH